MKHSLMMPAAMPVAGVPTLHIQAACPRLHSCPVGGGNTQAQGAVNAIVQSTSSSCPSPDAIHALPCRTQSISWSKLERIFVSSLAADNIAGLPGMLCTISAAREKGHEAADTPLHVYGPPGLAEYIK